MMTSARSEQAPLAFRATPLSLIFLLLSFVFSYFDRADESNDSTLTNINEVDSFSTFYKAAAHPVLVPISSSALAKSSEADKVSVAWPSEQTTATTAPQDRLTRPFLNSHAVLKQHAILSGAQDAQKALGMFCPIHGAAAHLILRHLSFVRHIRVVQLKHVALRDRERLLTRPGIFRFLFVRHPFTRALAVYRLGMSVDKEESRSKMVYDTERMKRISAFIARVRGIPIEQQEQERQQGIHLSYRMFLSLYSLYINDNNNNNNNNNNNSGEEQFENDDENNLFITQVDSCQVLRINYSFIGHVETLQQDLNKVNKRFGITTTIFPPYRSSDAQTSMRQVYTDKKMKYKSMKLFKTDLNSFGYSSSP